MHGLISEGRKTILRGFINISRLSITKPPHSVHRAGFLHRHPVNTQPLPPMSIPRFPLVADVSPNIAGPVWVRLKLDNGTLLPVAELTGPQDYKLAYAALFAGSLDLHAEMIDAAEALMSTACQPANTISDRQRENLKAIAIRCYQALRKADPDTF